MSYRGTCVALQGRGVLLRGPSGSGKSDLALRLIDDGAELVADDRVVLVPSSANTLTASAAPPLRGLLEVRELGIFRLPFRACVALALVVDLTDEAIERLPGPSESWILGQALPLIRLRSTSVSATARIRLALGTAEPIAGTMGDAA